MLTTGYQVKWLTLETVCQIGFGKSLKLLDQPKNRFIIKALHAYSMQLGVYIQWPSLQNLAIDKILALGQMLQSGGQDWKAWGRDFEASILNAHHAPQASLFGRILSSEDPKVKESFKKSELRAEGIFLMLAGMICIPSVERSYSGFNKPQY